MPSGSHSKNQSKACETACLHPRFWSRNSVLTSHGQSTTVATRRVSSARCASPDRFGRAPSAATYSRGGRAARIAANTSAVGSGRLNTRNRTGLRIRTSGKQSFEVSDGFLQPIRQGDLGTPIEDGLRQCYIGLTLAWIVRRQGVEHELG